MKNTLSGIFITVLLIVSMFGLAGCGGGGGGGGSASVPSGATLRISIPSLLLGGSPSLRSSMAKEMRAALPTGLVVKTVAYSNGKPVNGVNIPDRNAKLNGDKYVCDITDLNNAYDYRFMAYYGSELLMQNQISSSEVIGGNEVQISVNTSYKVLAYDAWLAANPNNGSMASFVNNCKNSGIDVAKEDAFVALSSVSAETYKEKMQKLVKGEKVELPTAASIDVSGISKESNTEPPDTVLYTISYNLNGGTVESANPICYGSNFATITLNNPTKVGYVFVGWTGSNGDVPQTIATIEKGSDGNKSFIANWKPELYTITYNLNGGSIVGANPTNYEIGSPTIILNNPTKDEYKFIGWTGSNGDVPQTDVTIAQGSTGNKEYTANWVVGDVIRFALAENVTLTMKKVPGKDYYAGIYEVTQAQYKAVMNNVNPSAYIGDNKPVEQVSWNTIMEDGTGFMARINALLATQLSNKTLTGYAFNLPSREQWEYTGRAGSTDLYCRAEDGNSNVTDYDILEYGWFNENCGATTHDVGAKKPNAWGFYDVHGNVSEWTLDVSNSDRGWFGGDWGMGYQYSRFPVWNYDAPDSEYGTIGFRVFLFPPAQ